MFMSHCYYEESKSLLNLQHASQKVNINVIFKIRSHQGHNRSIQAEHIFLNIIFWYAFVGVRIFFA